MRASFWASVATLILFGQTLLGHAPIAQAQSPSDAPIDSLVRRGAIRVAVFPPQYTKSRATNEVTGWPVELARALAARLHVQVAMIEYPGPRETMDALKAGACDLAFLPIEPLWSADVAFSSPLMQIDFTLLVPSGAPIRTVAEVDRPGLRIAVVRKHASTLALARIVKHAVLVDAEGPAAAFELLRRGEAGAFASVRPALLAFADKLPGSFVLEDRYGANVLTIAVAQAQSGELAYLNAFIEDAKASGLVQKAIDHAGWRGVEVARRAGTN